MKETATCVCGAPLVKGEQFWWHSDPDNLDRTYPPHEPRPAEEQS